MERDSDGTCDQKTHEVSHHQATQEDQEEGAWAAVCLPEGLDENYEGDEIGGQTQKGEYGWIIGWGNRDVVVEWRASYGVA